MMKIAPKAIRDEMAGRPVSPAQILYVDLFNVLPGHDARQAYPSVVFAQSAAKRLKKFFHRQLLAIVPVIHPRLHPYSRFFS